MDELRRESAALQDIIGERGPAAREGETATRLLDDLAPYLATVKAHYTAELVRYAQDGTPDMLGKLGNRLAAIEDIENAIRRVITDGTIAAEEVKRSATRLEQITEYFRRGRAA